ncbi:MAG: metallophosphoesterase family protein [Acidilobus sp.]
MATRILVLADVHYPNTVRSALRASLLGGYDKVVLLGDSVDDPLYLPDLIRAVSSVTDDVILVKGDNEERMGIDALERYELQPMGVVLLHGHRGDVLSEGFTKAVARAAARLSRRLVLETYAYRVRVKGKLVVVGHAHAIGYSRAFRVVFAGSLGLPSPSRPFNEVGYAVVESSRIELKDGTGRTLISLPLRP